MEALPHLVELVLSLNALTHISGIDHLHELTHLDISFNQVGKLEALCKGLEVLTANNNAVDSFDSVKYLAEKCDALGVLNLFCNPLSRFPRYRGKII